MEGSETARRGNTTSEGLMAMRELLTSIAWLCTPFETLPAAIRAGHLIRHGTRTPPSHVVPFSPRYGA